MTLNETNFNAHSFNETNNIKKEFLGLLNVEKKNRNYSNNSPKEIKKEIKINEAVANMTLNVDDERKKILNKELEQDIRLKSFAFALLFLFLATETVGIFYFAYLQGWDNSFRLEEWSFNLLVTATIGQITFMLQVAVKYLFNSRQGGS